MEENHNEIENRNNRLTHKNLIESSVYGRRKLKKKVDGVAPKLSCFFFILNAYNFYRVC